VAGNELARQVPELQGKGGESGLCAIGVILSAIFFVRYVEL